MNAGLLLYLGDGRVKCTSVVPSYRAANAIPFKDGSICIQTMGSIASYVSGLPYGPQGRIAVTTNVNQPIKDYIAGLGFVASGRLACSLDGAIHHYIRGIPVTADGRVAINLPVAELTEEENA